MTHRQKEKRNKEMTELYEVGLIEGKQEKYIFKYLAMTYNLSLKQVRNILKKKGTYENE